MGLFNRIKQDIIHPFGIGNPQPQQPQPIRTPAPLQQAPRPIASTAPRPMQAPQPSFQMPHFNMPNPLHAVGNFVHNDIAAPVQRDIVQPVSHAIGNTVNAFSAHSLNNNVIQPVLHVPQHIDQYATQSALGRGAQTVGLGALRSGVGTVQGVAGLDDALNHKLGLYNGPSPFSDKLNNLAKNIDQTAQAEHANPLLYHGSQAATDLLQFAMGGGELKAGLKAAQEAPKVGRAVNTAVKVVNAGEKLATKATQGLREGNVAQRVAGRAIQNIANPKYQAANAAFTALQAGKQISQGQHVSPQSIATNLAIGGVAFPAAGAVAHEATAPVLNKAVQALRSSNLVRPTNLTDAELNASAKVLNANSGSGLNTMDISSQDMAHFHNAQVKLGAKPGTPDGIAAVDNALHQHQAYDSKVLQRKQALEAIKQQINEATTLNESGKALVTENGSTVPTLKKLVGKEQPAPAATTKTRGLTKGIKNSPEFSPELQQKVSSTYTPFTDKAANQTTDKFMKQPLDDAQTQVMAALSEGQGTHIKGASGNLGVKFGKQEVSNAGAVMKALDQAGRHDEAQAIHDALAQKLTNAGQTSQAASLIYNRTPDGLANMARKTLGNAGVKPDKALQAKMDAAMSQIKATKDGTKANDLARKQYDKVVGSAIPTSTGSKLLSLYKTGILSSPKTAVKVGMVQLPNQVAEHVTDAVAAPIDKAVSLISKKRAVTAPGIESTKAAVKALPGALQDAKTRFKDDIVMPNSSGMAVSELSSSGPRAHGANFGVAKGGGRTKLDQATNGVSSKLLNGYTSSIGRVHGALQTIPYETRRAEALAQSAVAEAKNKSLSGSARKQFIADFQKNPPKWAVEQADTAAQYATNQQKTALGEAAGQIQRTMPGGQIIAPITRIPGAVATQVVNYSPAGALKTSVQAVLDKRAGNAFDQAAFSRGMARSVVGSGLMVGGGALALQGRVSGAYPKDKATQTLWQSANIPANSVYVGGHAFASAPWKNTGGTWQQISSPGGAPAQAALTGGSVIDGYQKGGVANAALGGVQGGASIVTNQPYLTGVSGAMGAINTPTQAKSFLDQTAGSVVPNFVRDVATSTDPLQRQTSVQSPITSMKNSITNGIPGLRENNQPQLDVFGNQLVRNNGVLNTALNPLNPQRSTPSALTNALGDIHNTQDVNGKPLTIPSQINKKFTIKDATGKTTPLSDAQRTQFIQQSGQAAQAQMNQAIHTPAYQNADPTQRAKMLADIMDGNRNVTKLAFGDAGKLTAAGKMVKDGSLPTIGTNGKVTASGTTNLNPNVPADQAKILKQYANMSAADRTKAENTQNDFEYNHLVAQYANDKANNKLSTVQDIKAREAIDKAKVGKDYSKQVRDLYGLNKNELYTYLTTPEKGVDKNALANQVIAYDDALTANGIQAKNKFRLKDGSVAIQPGTKSSRGGSRGSSRKGSTPAEIAAAFSSRNTNTYKFDKTLRGIAQKASMGKSVAVTKSGTSHTAKLKSYSVKMGSSTPKPRKAFA